MADILFSCPKCGGSLVVDTTGAGWTVPCPLCGERIEVPVPDAGPAPMEFVPLPAQDDPEDAPLAVDELIDRMETVGLPRAKRWFPRVLLGLAIWVGIVVVVGGVHLHSTVGVAGLDQGATEVTGRFGWFLNPLNLVVDIGALPPDYSREKLGKLLQALARAVPLVPGMGIEFSTVTVKQDGDTRFDVVGVVWHEVARAEEMSPREVLQFFSEHALDAQGRTMEEQIGRNASDPTHAAETILYQTLVPAESGSSIRK